MKTRLPGLLAMAALLAACSSGGETSSANSANASPGNSGDGDITQSPNTVPNQRQPDQAGPAARYEVTIVNLTAAQPFSPPAVLLHGSAYQLFANGQPAGVALEALAEGGDNSGLLNMVAADAGVYAAGSADGPIGPGSSISFTVNLPAGNPTTGTALSAAMMLVNTNDAIGAVRSLRLEALEAGQSQVWDLASFDTGTEANDELAMHIPGPAGGGSGFDPARDDFINAVLPHPAPITGDDGLADSALREIHRWVDPVGRIHIRRLM